MSNPLDYQDAAGKHKELESLVQDQGYEERDNFFKRDVNGTRKSRMLSWITWASSLLDRASHDRKSSLVDRSQALPLQQATRQLSGDNASLFHIDQL